MDLKTILKKLIIWPNKEKVGAYELILEAIQLMEEIHFKEGDNIIEKIYEPIATKYGKKYRMVPYKIGFALDCAWYRESKSVEEVIREHFADLKISSSKKSPMPKNFLLYLLMNK